MAVIFDVFTRGYEAVVKGTCVGAYRERESLIAAIKNDQLSIDDSVGLAVSLLDGGNSQPNVQCYHPRSK